VIECVKLSKVYKEETLPVEVLKNIDFTLMQGEQVAITGSSGSGKSTLLHLLGGLEVPTQGQVSIAQTEISGLGQGQRAKLRNRYLGFVYQFHYLLPEFNALENVAMPLLIGGCAVSEATERAGLILEKVGLKQRLQHRPAQLSGGERQRAAIARALVTEPQCVLADEPTGNLDNRTADEVYELMLSLNTDLGTSFVIVTHDHQLAAKMDVVYTLEDGKLSVTSDGGGS
jgi:lipoprotein-releasing system ATP-binding protein